MEIFDLHNFASADLRPLLEREVETWQSTLHWDYRMLAEMILRYIDSHILPGVAATEGGRVCGYCFFLADGAKGGIGDLYVEDSDSTHDLRHSIEIALVSDSIRKLQSSVGLQRVETQLLIQPADHLTGPFIAEGYRCHRRVFLSRPIDGTYPKPSQPLACEIRRWQISDFEASANIIAAAYRGHIDCEVGDQFRTSEGTLGFMNNIVRFPTCGVFDWSASFTAIDRTTKSPIAVLLCSRLRDDVGHVTQVCTLPEYRGFGVGEHLLRQCYDDLANRGFTEVSLTVTEQNHRAVALYRRLGFQLLHSFDAFVWEA